MLKNRFLIKKVKRRIKEKRLVANRDLISYEELIGKLVRLHDSLFIVNGDLVIQKSVGTETSNLLTNKNIIRK